MPSISIAAAIWSEAEPADNTRKIAFTIGVIALAAKMAKADGEVTRDEIAAFREIFTVDADEIENVNRIFDLACAAIRPGSKAMRSRSPSFSRPASPVLEQLLDGLFHIAKADGKVPQAEIDYLRRVATIFGFEEVCVRAVSAAPSLGHRVPRERSLLRAGGKPGRMSETVDQSRLIAVLVRENHLDMLMAQGLPLEEADAASATPSSALYNTAWESIQLARLEIARSAASHPLNFPRTHCPYLMAQAPLVQLTGAMITFGGRPLFSGIDMALARRRSRLPGRARNGKAVNPPC